MRRRCLGWLLGGISLLAAGCGAAPGPLTSPSALLSSASAPATQIVAPAALPSLSPATGAGVVGAGAVRLGTTNGAPAAPSGSPTTLAIRAGSLRLPAPTTRAVAFATASGLVVAGGLTPTGTTGRVVRIPVDGRPAATVGRLAHPVHDAAGAVLHGSMLVFGGGASTQDAWVQRVLIGGAGDVPGRLPSARADLAAVATGSQVIVIGGGASGRADPRVLATSDGVHFRTVADLPVPVRYAAVAAVGATVVVVGGTSSTGDVAVIQAVDLRRGTATVVGRLPRTLSHATALVIGGVVVIAGGRHGGRALDGVLGVDPASYRVRAAGHLPRPESDAAGAVIDDVGYLVGGESTGPLATIVTIAAG